MSSCGIDDIKKLIRKTLNPHRYEHTMNVLGMAEELAELHGVDAEKARMAAICHDLCKNCTEPGNDLSHAGDAAELMRTEYGIDDDDILNAVRYHTTGRAGMSKLELIVFLADTLEPSRTYDGVERLRGLVCKDLYAGALEVLKELNDYLIKTGKSPAQDSIDAIEWLQTEIRRSTKYDGRKK